MKKTLALLLVFLILTALSACKKNEPVPTTEPGTTAATEIPTGTTEPEEPSRETETVAAVQQTESAAPAEPETRPTYGTVLDSYYNALMEQWPPEKYMGAGMNYLPGLIGDPEKVGYYLEDLDGNGFPELLIGAVGEDSIFVMYTMVEGAPLTVLRASERNTYRLTADGIFHNQGSNGAAFTGHLFYTYQNGDMHFQDALMFNSDADGENPWFYAVDEDWDVSNDLPYGTGDAEAYIRMVEQSIVEIPYVPFSEYTS